MAVLYSKQGSSVGVIGRDKGQTEDIDLMGRDVQLSVFGKVKMNLNMIGMKVGVAKMGGVVYRMTSVHQYEYFLDILVQMSYSFCRDFVFVKDIESDT